MRRESWNSDNRSDFGPPGLGWSPAVIDAQPAHSEFVLCPILAGGKGPIPAKSRHSDLVGFSRIYSGETKAGEAGEPDKSECLVGEWERLRSGANLAHRVRAQALRPLFLWSVNIHLKIAAAAHHVFSLHVPVSPSPSSTTHPRFLVADFPSKVKSAHRAVVAQFEFVRSLAKQLLFFPRANSGIPQGAEQS